MAKQGVQTQTDDQGFVIPRWAREVYDVTFDDKGEVEATQATTLNDAWEDDVSTDEPKEVSLQRVDGTIPAKEAFFSHSIVPDVLKLPPKHGIQIVYGMNSTVYYGNFLLDREVVHQPKRIFWESDPNALYTMILSAPDMPTREYPIQREWLLWLVGNIPGSTWGAADVIADYQAPYGGRGIEIIQKTHTRRSVTSIPPQKKMPGGKSLKHHAVWQNFSDIRRFVFVVFKQKKNINFDKLHSTRGQYIKPSVLRALFSSQEFAKKLKLGDPIAANFFQIRPVS